MSEYLDSLHLTRGAVGTTTWDCVYCGFEEVVPDSDWDRWSGILDENNVSIFTFDGAVEHEDAGSTVSESSESVV